jgi:hypothetical protein
VVCETNPFPVSTDDQSCTAVPGQPRISARVAASGSISPGVMYVDLRLANTGGGHARNILINQLRFRTLAGTGTPSISSTMKWPYSNNSLDIGHIDTLQLILDVPSTVTRFSINEAGIFEDLYGINYNFSFGQVLKP